MRRLICMALLCCMAVTGFWSLPAAGAQAETVWLDRWELSAIPEGNSGAEFIDDSLSLWFQTSGEEGRAAAVHDIPNPGGCLCLSFTVRLAGLDYSNNRKLYLKNPDSLNVMELVNFKGDTLQAFGQEVRVGLEENRSYAVTLALRPADQRAAVWLETEQVFDRTLGSGWKNFDLDALQLEFCNYTFPKDSALASSFVIGSPCLVPAGGTLQRSNPEDGAVFVTPAAIEMDFGGQVSPAMGAAETWTLLEDDQPVPAEAAQSGGIVTVKPVGGFGFHRSYELISRGQWDVFGQPSGSAIRIAFTTAPEGYRAPTAQIKAGVQETWQGCPVPVTCTASGSAEIDRVVYAADGREVYTSTEGPDFLWDFQGEAGSHRLRAVAYDVYQNASAPSEITVTILPNQLPQVSFSGLEEGGVYPAGALAETVVSALDPDEDGALARVEVWVDGALFTTLTQAPYAVDLSGLAKGGHVLSALAVDQVGAVGRAEVSIVVAGESVSTVIYENDLEGYVSGGTEFPTNIGVVTGDARIVSSAAYGDAHGTVAELSSQGQDENGKSPSGSWIGFPTSGAGTRFTVELDLNARQVPKSYYFMIKESGVMELATDVGIANGQFYAKNGKETAYLSFEEDHWYRLRYQVDLAAKKYSFWVDGQALATNFAIGNQKLTKADFRFIMEIPTGTQPGKVALDNLRVSKSIEEPVIAGISAEGQTEDGLIPPEAARIEVALTASVTPESVSAETVVVYRDGQPVVLEEAYYDGVIVLVLAEKLRSLSEYRVELSTGVQDGGGISLTEPLTAGFETGLARVDADGLQVRRGNGRVWIEGTAVDADQTGGTYFVVLTVWDGGRMTGLSVTPVEWADGTVFRTQPVELSEGQTLEYAVWDSLNVPGVIAMGSM